MHNHNQDNTSHNSMMWAMILCCVLPFLLLAIFGNLLQGAWRWVILIVIALFMAVHLRRMMRPHHSEKDKKSSSKSHGCH